MPTNRFLAKQSYTSLENALPKLARFLVNDLGGFTGPGWTIIDSYCASSSSPHEVPPTATDMDSFTGTNNGWKTGLAADLAPDDYIVLESASSSNKWQLGIEFQSSTVMRLIAAPKGGWVTANNDADMTAAGNWGQAKLSTVDVTCTNANGNYTIVADEDRMIFAFEDGATYAWEYVGKIDNVHTGDSKPVVIYTAPATVYAQYNAGLGANNWKKLSAVDLTTEITPYGLMGEYQGNIGPYLTTATTYSKESLSNEYRGLPIYISGSTAGNYGIFGNLRGVWAAWEGLGSGTGTLGGKAYAYMQNNAGSAVVVWSWDSSTAF